MSSTIHDFTKEVTVMVPVIIAKTIFEETHYKVLLIFVYFGIIYESGLQRFVGHFWPTTEGRMVTRLHLIVENFHNTL